MPVLRRIACASVWTLAVSLPLAASAQVYRSVGPDGRVTYSDRPPQQARPGTPGGRVPEAASPGAPGARVTEAASPGAPGARAPARAPEPARGGTPGSPVQAPAGGMPGAAATAALPFELRSIANRFPVTLYTAADCIPCVSGRNLLASRGIPFSERTVATADDVEALRRQTGQGRVPVLAIGTQQLPGFSESEWSQYLDVAGYPRESRLPGGWRNPAPAPLAAVRPAAPVPAREPEPAESPIAAPAPMPVPALPTADNPAGIRF